MAQDNYAGILWEEINERLKLIQESLSAWKDVPTDVKRLKDDMVEVRTDIKTMKAVLIDQSKTLNHHEIRLTNLETV